MIEQPQLSVLLCCPLVAVKIIAPFYPLWSYPPFFYSDTLYLNNILENIKLDVAAYQALGIYLFVLFNLEFLQINEYLSLSRLHTEIDVGRQMHVSVFYGITEV